MELSSKDSEKLADIYVENILIEMDAGSVMGGTPTSGGSIENTDDYAPGDTRIPKLLGDVQTRKGKVKKKSSKKKKKRSAKKNRL